MLWEMTAGSSPDPVAAPNDVTAERDQPPRESDRVIIQRMRQNDSRALAALVASYANRLTRFAFNTVGSRDSADDVVQQVFIQLWERRATLDPECRLKPYLFRAVRNRALNESQASTTRDRYRRDVQAAVAGGTVSGAVESPEGAILTAAAVQASIAQLPQRRRLALALRLTEEMTHAEIGEVLGVSSEAAQRLVARAIADLREILRRGV